MPVLWCRRYGHVWAASAQWLNYPAPGVPGCRTASRICRRRRRGRATASRICPASGRPSSKRLKRTSACSDRASAAFTVPGDDPTTFSQYFFNILLDFAPADPMTADARGDVKNRRTGRRKSVDVCTACRRAAAGRPQELRAVQDRPDARRHRGAVRAGQHPRQIYTDGRQLPVDPNPTWGGYSVGRWEGDTLVVERRDSTIATWLDFGGHPHSEALRIQSDSAAATSATST